MPHLYRCNGNDSHLFAFFTTFIILTELLVPYCDEELIFHAVCAR